ncbi:MAG: PxxKW family cysteine-rich protein [Desulfuromonadaceae bacterium]|nr:PxxKW family cysteine-rich protein [Desulfuromonadaceae bacterium]
MQCQTIQPGNECNFWTKKGCSFEGNACHNVVVACEGCDRIVNSEIGSVCSSYPAPEKKWATGLCNFATHQKVKIDSVEAKVNPLKASKRAAGKKK